MSFSDLGLTPELLRAIADSGYSEPTPIQAQAIPVVLMGRDVLGSAQTGTGKTASFTLPMIDILSSGRAKARMPRSLIVEPTRELAAQVAQSFEKYGKYANLTHSLIVGGEGFTDQEAKLMRGVDVLIATPGRLLDLFERGKILLADVKILVIDEADRMLDMGFIPDIERIVGLLPKIRQTLFFSATMAPEIRRLADAFLMNPKEIAVAPPATTASNVEQNLILVEAEDKREALRRQIRAENVANALIFCNRKVDVEILYRSLHRHGFSVARLHGDMPQSKRTETLAQFKSGTVSLMVCSDVAARGIDIKGLSHVFNFDVPIHAEDYVHRIGRTGRAGAAGRAITLATPFDGKAVGAIESLIGQPIPRLAAPGFADLEFLPESEAKRRGRGAARGKSRPSSGGERRAEKPAPSGRPARGSRTRAAAKPEIPIVALAAPVEANPHHATLTAGTALPPALPIPAPQPLAAVAILPTAIPAKPISERPISQSAEHDAARREASAQAADNRRAMISAEHSQSFGDHLPAFMRRPVRLPGGDRRAAK